MKHVVMIAGSVALAAATGVAIGVNPSVLRSSASAEPASPPASSAATVSPPPGISLAEVLRARSPGERGIHVLTKVKASPFAMNPPRSRQVAGRLPAAGAPPLPTPFAATGPGPTVVEGPLPVDDPGPGAVDFTDVVESPPPPVTIVPTPPIGPSNPFIPVSPVAPIDPGVPTNPVVPPVAVIPEPATWGMMLVGFAAIAATMRRRSYARSTASV